MSDERVKARLDRILATIKSIVASRDVERFVVGVTTEDPTARISAYRKEGFEHFAGVAFLSNRETALAVENAVFDACCKDKKLRQKYHVDKRDKPYYRSGGRLEGRKIVYIAWWSR